MKKIAKILMPAMLAMMMTACQPTPDMSHVHLKEDAFWETTETTTAPDGKTSAAEAWTGNFTSKAYPMHTRVDVKMQLPDKPFSIYSISPQKITQQQIHRFHFAEPPDQFLSAFLR